MEFEFPSQYLIKATVNGNPVRQLYIPKKIKTVDAEPFKTGRAKGILLTDGQGQSLVITNGAQPPDEFERVLRVKRPKGVADEESLLGSQIEKVWLKPIPPSISLAVQADWVTHCERIRNSWLNQFSFREERRDSASNILQAGLRAPQIGAVYAALSHWTTSNEPATVIMPTGTGKTETMLAVLIASQCEKLLVIVPTDPLREQIAQKFITLGILKDFGIVSEKAEYPVVGLLRHRPKSIEEADAFFQKCNVIVTTMAIAGGCSDEVQKRMAQLCSHLFIDEAHHIGARTWKEFKKKFESRKILQFTATPFREDDKPVEGKPIFNYPLRKAQEEGYFRPIHFKPVKEFDPAKFDQAIAERAVQQLREDRKKYNHILMARVGSVERAKEVFSIYEQYTEFNPVQIHTGIESKIERDKIRKRIISGEAKIIVCVDMLGEGFDLPQLKIAAFHDIRKGLAVTLQLAGRFTRSSSNLGDATFIANIADIKVQEERRKLYSQDADWNVLLRETSEEIIQEQIDLREFLEGFKKFPQDIPLQNLCPAMSTVLYRTKCQDWKPDNFQAGIPGIESFERVHYDVNPLKRTLVIVIAKKVPIDWIKSKEIYNWDWELYILFWDKIQNLLFIHSSSNTGSYRMLATAVAGEIEPIKGPPVFRSFYGVKRLRLQNVGLREQLGRLIRHTMRAGSNVEPGLTEAQKRKAEKSVIFGAGYENGRKVTVGCSYKGRIWSYLKTNLDALTKWCSFIGNKVLDETIDPDQVLKGTLVSVPISQRPQLMPITIDWPETMYQEYETAYEFIVDDGSTLRFYQTDINLKNPDETSDIRFEIRSGTTSIEYLLSLFEKDGVRDYRFSIVGNQKALIRKGADQMAIEEFFYENPPVIWFVDGSSLIGNDFTELKREFNPYPSEKIQAWDWTGVNIRKESQGITKEADSIQYRVIEELKKKDYDIIFDDDGSGEAADVVAIRIEDKSITVEFYHCKFSQQDKPGGRIKDLYEVCGQAQKSIHWMEMERPTELFAHLLRREPKKESGQEITRYQKGDRDELYKIKEMSRILPVELKVFIVQPGLSKAQVSIDQQELLSVTENHLMETYLLPFGVIASL